MPAVKIVAKEVERKTTEKSELNPRILRLLHRRRLKMMDQTRKSMLGILVPAIVFIGLWGCGDDDTQTGTDALSMLEPSIQALDTRLQSHYETVAGVLNSAEARNDATQGGPFEASAETQELGLMNEDWEAIHRERGDYGQDMHRILNNLGETVTTVGACQMMMGGMMFGHQHDEDTCPCEPYMDVTDEEIDQHLSEMLTWMDQQDPSGLLEEMNGHWEQLRSHIQDMDSHMRQTYGSHGGMKGMM
jgi:hypothetical protein